MYKPYLSRQKSGKSVQTTVSAGDKTTLKLVTEQLRASQKVLNKSDQFIPSVVAWCGDPAAQSAPDTGARPIRGQDGEVGDQWEAGAGLGWPVLSLSQPLAGPTELSWVRQLQANIMTFLAISLDPTSDNDKSNVWYLVLVKKLSSQSLFMLPSIFIFLCSSNLLVDLKLTSSRFQTSELELDFRLTFVKIEGTPNAWWP